MIEREDVVSETRCAVRPYISFSSRISIATDRAGAKSGTCFPRLAWRTSCSDRDIPGLLRHLPKSGRALPSKLCDKGSEIDEARAQGLGEECLPGCVLSGFYLHSELFCLRYRR